MIAHDICGELALTARMNSHSFSYSMAESSDLPSVCELLSQSGLPHEDVSLHLPNMVVAKTDGCLVGVVGIELHGDAALMRSVCVSKHYRSLGVATHLCDLASAHARNLGATNLHLLTTNASQFFGARGFVKCSRSVVPDAIQASAQFLSLCPASAVCMVLRLSAGALYLPSAILPLREDVPGARMWAASLRSTMLTYFEVEPHTRFETHSHAGEQITTVIDGELFFVVDNRTVRVGAGEVMAIPPCIAHEVFTRGQRARAFDAWSPPPPRYAVPVSGRD